MPVDPSIFFQGAALQNQNAQNLQAQLSSAIAVYNKNKEESGLPDIESAAQVYAYKKAAGIEPTPEEVAGAKAYDMLRSTEQMAGPYGGTMPKYRSLFGDVLPAGGGYVPTYTQGGEDFTNVPAPPAGGAMPNLSKPKATATDNMDEYNLVPMTEEQAAGLLSGKIDPQTLKPDAPVPQDSPLFKQPKERGSVGADMAKLSEAYGSPLDQKITLEMARDLQKEEIKAGLKEQADIRTEERKAQSPKEYTGEQARAVSYAYRMSQAAKDMEDFTSKNKKAELAAKTPIGMLGSALADVPSLGVGQAIGKTAIYASANPEQQKYLKAADSWIRAKLRKESGAVISDSEWMNEYKTYFPTATDSKETIQYKKRLRQDAQKAIINEGAGLYELQYGAQKPVQSSTDYKSKYGLE